MKISRNDPCHCGSGKKYKQCCLQKDSAPVAPPPPKPKAPPPFNFNALPPPAPLPPTEDSPEVAAWRQFWDALKGADHAQKIEMIREKILTTSPADLSGDLAFDLFDSLHTSLKHTDRGPEIKADLEQLRTLHPDAYDAERMWFELWHVEHALASGIDPTADFLRLCAGAHKVIDSFFALLEQMRYHGHHDALLQGLPIAIQVMEGDSNILPNALTKAISAWVELVLHAHLQRDPALTGDDPQLIDALSAVSDLKLDAIAHIVEMRKRAQAQTWTLASFKGSAGKSGDNDAMLLWAFNLMLAREADWPASRRDQARIAIFQMLEEATHTNARFPSSQKHTRGKKPQKAKAAQPKSLSPLIPDMDKLTRHLGIQMRPLFGSPYMGEVLLLALPWWLAFLVEQGLEDEATAQQLWRRVHTVFADVILDIMAQPGRDRVLAQHLRETFDRQDLPKIRPLS
jgi:hypothetical protein